MFPPLPLDSTLLSLTFCTLLLYMSTPSSVFTSVCLFLFLSLFFSPHGSPWLCSICQACNFSSSDSRPFLVFAGPSLSLSLPLPTLSIQSTPTSLLQQWNLVEKYVHALKLFVFSSIINSLFIICPCLLFTFSSLCDRANRNHWPESVLAVAVTLSHFLKSANLLFCQPAKDLF